MAYEFATWLAEALKKDPFVSSRLVEESGWQTRGRPFSTGPFTPAGVLEHHTACMDPPGHNGRSCAIGCRDGNSSLPGPISQLHIASLPSPKVTILAAGRSNHGNGSNVHTGVPWAGNSKDWNAHTIGIEVCGPPPVKWSDEVIELRARVTSCLLKHMGVGSDRVFLHGGINSNKIDPSGPWPGEPNLAQLTTWSTSKWRSEVDSVSTPTPPTPPTPPTTLVPKPTLRRGDSGSEVTLLIDILKQNNWYPSEHMGDKNDGSFGGRCEAGVKNMQKQLGQIVDGVYGPQTATALTTYLTPPTPPTPTPTPGDTMQPVLIQVDHSPSGGFFAVVYLCSADYMTHRWVQNEAELNLLKVAFAMKGWDNNIIQVPESDLGQFGVLLGPTPSV